MSGAYAAGHAGLCDALDTVGGLRVLRRPGALGNPPVAYVPPPELTWDGYVTEPTEAVFEVVLAVAADDRAIENLFRFLPLVTAAIEDAEQVDAVVKTATPGVWRTGNTELPCYFIRTEVAV